ncbi:MAG: PKD domain-containing protein [Flavobacteriales bacterium]|nr:PKD domain-containing protein [Flavobacteriales bacterium]
MSSAQRSIKAIGGLLVTLLTGALSAQPHCDAILRPAFHYEVDGLTVSLADSSMTFGVGTTAQWSFGDGSGLTSTPEHTFDQPGVYTICLTLTAMEGPPCASTYCHDVEVPLTACPSVAGALFGYSASGTNTCTFQLASGLSSTGALSWDFGDGYTSNDTAPTHTWALPGPHFVTLTDRSTDCVTIYSEWVAVDGNATTCGPGLFVDFSTTVLDQQTIRFEPDIVTSSVATLLGVWSFGDGVVDSAFTTQHTYAEAGRYQTCFLVGALAQPGLDTCFSLVCRMVEVLPMVTIAEASSAACSIWPNPAHGILHIRTAVPGPAAVTLYDAIGRPILIEKLTDGRDASIDLAGMASGSYILMLKQAGTSMVRRLQVQQWP